MKNIKVLFFVSLFVFLNTSYMFSKSNEPLICPVKGAQTINSGSNIKKINLKLYKKAENFFIEDVSNEILFELLGYDEKKSEWVSLGIFSPKETTEISIKQKMKIVALVPYKNCEELEIGYEKNGSTLTISLEHLLIIKNSEPYRTIKNTEGSKAEMIKFYCRELKTSPYSVDVYDVEKNAYYYNGNVIKEFPLRDKQLIDVYLNEPDLIFKIQTGDSSQDPEYLIKNDEIIVEATHSDIEFLGQYANQIYYRLAIGEHPIYKDKEQIVPKTDWVRSSVYEINGNVYYSSENTIYKNNEVLKKLDQMLFDFAVGINDELAYIVFDENADMLLYKNDLLYAKASYLYRPTYSPDGKKFYFIEGKPRGGNYNAYYLYGDFPVPPTTGFTLVGEFKFSQNSKYIATAVDDLQAKKWYILSGKILGPFDYTSENYYFSDDSKSFIYRYYDSKTKKWIDAEEKMN